MNPFILSLLRYLTQDKDAQAKLIICCLYLILGLAIIAMSFNLVQEEVIYHAKRTLRDIILRNVCYSFNPVLLPLASMFLGPGFKKNSRNLLEAKV